MELAVGTHQGLRERFNAFVARHEVAWELSMAMLALAYVAIGFVPEESSTAPTLEAIDLGLTALFVAEFASRFAATFDRRAYLRGHWIDLVALTPAVRGLRALRLLRLLRLLRAFAGIYRAVTQIEALGRHRGFLLIFMSWVAVMALCSIALYAAENGVNAAITSPYDAIWWGVVTVTTGGEADTVPVTAEGRLAAAVLMILGLALFAAITATITSFLLVGESLSADPVEQLRRLAELRETGAINEAEFERVKTEVLGRLPQGP